MTRTQTNAPTRKAIAGTGGAFTGQYLGEILLYVIERFAGDLPANIDSAVIGLVAAAMALAAAYYTPPAPDEGVF